MNIISLIIFFILGLFMGSFYTVVGLRLPKKENFLSTRSYCDKCHHSLSFLDMFPILSYIFLRGRCHYCKAKIDSLSTFMEFFTGVLFALSYYTFGFSYELLIALGIVSMLVIISVSDITYLIIPDEVLVFFTLYFVCLFIINNGLLYALIHLLFGLITFSIMYLIMLLGDFLFKKETLGGGDIKLMFVVGLVLTPLLGILVIFVGSLLALPVSLLLLIRRNQKLIPFGPFLLIAFAFVYFTRLDFQTIINFLTFIK